MVRELVVRNYDRNVGRTKSRGRGSGKDFEGIDYNGEHYLVSCDDLDKSDDDFHIVSKEGGKIKTEITEMWAIFPQIVYHLTGYDSEKMEARVVPIGDSDLIKRIIMKRERKKALQQLDDFETATNKALDLDLEVHRTRDRTRQEVVGGYKISSTGRNYIG